MSATSPESKPDEAPSDALRPLIPRGGLIVAFAVTWVSYGSYYLGRKGLSVAKKTIGRELGDRYLFGVETAYLLMYAIGQYLNGLLGDRIGARRLIGFGMLLSAAACVGFGLSGAWLLFIAAMFVNGFAQSSGWPGNIKAMAEWVPPERRGATMGLWSTCYQVGGIVATGAAAWFMTRYGWRGAFIGPGVIIALVGLAVLALLKPGPLAPKTEAAEKRGGSLDVLALREAQRDARRAVLGSFTVWAYGVSYFFIKLIRYSLLFWLPYYLETVLRYTAERAAWASTSFEIGGVLGTIALGRLSDRSRHLPRSVFAAGSLVGLAGALYLYLLIGGSGFAANFLAMALVGALLFGPDAMLSGAAAQDAGGPYAAALAAGVVNGIGSSGAIFQELVTRGISDAWGWEALFRAFVGFALLAALALAPTLRGKSAGAASAAG